MEIREYVEEIKRLYDIEIELVGGNGDIVRAIDAALAACDNGGWRTMESAPKDGDAMLVSRMSGALEVCWWDDDQERWTNGYHAVFPTHWQPLPLPPKEDACG